MAKLNPDEREALRAFQQQRTLRCANPPLILIADYLRALSQLPASLRPQKPAQFIGQSWKL